MRILLYLEEKNKNYCNCTQHITNIPSLRRKNIGPDQLWQEQKVKVELHRSIKCNGSFCNHCFLFYISLADLGLCLKPVCLTVRIHWHRSQQWTQWVVKLLSAIGTMAKTVVINWKFTSYANFSVVLTNWMKEILVFVVSLLGTPKQGYYSLIEQHSRSTLVQYLQSLIFVEGVMIQLYGFGGFRLWCC